MRITRLSIQNFRSNEDLTFEVPQICALIGPNNAGKNNILEALRRVLGRNWVTVSSFSPDDVFMHDSERAVTISCWLDPPVFVSSFQGRTLGRYSCHFLRIHTVHIQRGAGERRCDQAKEHYRPKHRAIISDSVEQRQAPDGFEEDFALLDQRGRFLSTLTSVASRNCDAGGGPARGI
jgi:AAA ATPase domain